MKIKNLFLIASVAALLAGCNRGNSLADEPDGPQPLPTDAAGTMNVSLKYAVQTRASYEQGSDSESSAKTLTIYFFDDDAEHTYLGVGESSSLTSKPGDLSNGIDKKITAVEVPANVVGSLYGNEGKTMYGPYLIRANLHRILRQEHRNMKTSTRLLLVILPFLMQQLKTTS